jgi:hypothetical protein
VGSFGDKATKKDDEKTEGFQLLGGTLLVEVAVDRERMQVLYEQVKEATKQAVLDGYEEAAAAIVAADQAQPAPHVWQEHNEHGNTCNYPGCALTEEQHPAAPPAAEQAASPA